MKFDEHHYIQANFDIKFMIYSIKKIKELNMGFYVLHLNKNNEISHQYNFNDIYHFLPTLPTKM